MKRDMPHFANRSTGSALVLILIILGIAAIFLFSKMRSNPQIERDKITADAMAQAKDALIGYAATYRDTHPSLGPVYDQVFGYLPCPDTNNDGEAEANCGNQDVSVIGRLPWKTLGLPPLRDSTGECLWYAVSGNFKNDTKTAVLNWDTAGQFVVQDAGGATLTGATAETRAVAVIFSPRGVIGAQNRTPAGASECGGNTTIAAYLDGSDPFYAGTAPAPGATTTLTVATVSSLANGTNNDQALWLTPADIFKRVKKRSDFATDIFYLLRDIRDQAGKDAACTPLAVFNAPTGITDPGGLGKAIGLAPVSHNCISPAPGEPGASQRKKTYDNWRNNVLYATCPSSSTPCLTVNGDSNCAAVVVFSGERASGRTRPSTDAVDYLEGNNLSAFTTTSTTLSGAGPYSYTSSAADIALCIPPLASAGKKYPSFVQTAYTKTMINNTASEAIDWSGADSGLTKLTFAWGEIQSTGGTISADTNSIGVSTGAKVSLAAGEALTYKFYEPRQSIDVRLKRVGSNPRSFKLTAKDINGTSYVIDVPNCTVSDTTFFGGMRFGSYDTSTGAANPTPNGAIPTFPTPFPNADVPVEYVEIKIEATGTSVIQLDGFDSRGNYDGLQGAAGTNYRPNPLPTYQADSSLPHPYPQCFWDALGATCPRVKQPATCWDWGTFKSTYNYSDTTKFGFEPISSSDSITKVKMDPVTYVYSFRDTKGVFSTRPYQSLTIGGYTYYLGSYSRTNSSNFTAKLYNDAGLTSQYSDRVPLDTPYTFTVTGTGFSSITLRSSPNTFRFTDAAADFNNVFIKVKIGSTTYYLKNANPNNTTFDAQLYSDPQMTVPVTVAPPTGQAYTLTTNPL